MPLFFAYAKSRSLIEAAHYIPHILIEKEGVTETKYNISRSHNSLTNVVIAMSGYRRRTPILNSKRL